MAGSVTEVGVTSNVVEARAWLRAIGHRHIPFATAKALTRVAVFGRNAARGQLRKSFTLRSKGLPRAIGSAGARKSDWPKPNSLVLVQPWAAFLKFHALGGVRKPTKGRALAIPTRLVVDARLSSGRVRKGWRAKSILSKRTGYISDTGAVRRRRTKRTKLGLSLFAHLVPEARYKAGRYPFEPVVRRTVAKSYGPTFLRTFKAAIKDG